MSVEMMINLVMVVIAKGLPLQTPSPLSQETQDGCSQKNNNGSSEGRASNSEGDDGEETPHRRIAKVKRSHELDVEENPQMSVEEAWDKLGLKRSHDPMFECVLKFKPQSPPGIEDEEDDEIKFRREVYSLDIPDYLVPGAPEHNNTEATGKK